MQRFVRTFAFLVSLLLLAGVVAACGGGGEAEPTATAVSEPTEAPEATPTEVGEAEPTVAPAGASAFDSFHYTVAMEFTISEPGAEDETFISGQVEGDFVTPDSHAFSSTFEFAGLSATQEVVIIDEDAWLRQGGGDWTETARLDTEVQDAISLSSADAGFLQDQGFAEDLAVLDSEPETINGVETRKYFIPSEAVDTLVGLLGEDFLADASGLEEFEMTVWLEEETGALVRAEFTATATAELLGEDAVTGLSPDATLAISMAINLTQINSPSIEIEPPI